MANEDFVLRKGLLENLADVPVVNGTLLFTIDEKAIYLDANNERRRIGNFIEVDSPDELYVDGDLTNPNLSGTLIPWSTNAFYYIPEENALLRWTGDQWVRINDTADADSLLASLQQQITTIEENISNLQSDNRTINQNITNLQTNLQQEIEDRQTNENAFSQQLIEITNNITKYDDRISDLEAEDRDLSDKIIQEAQNRAAADDKIREDYAAADDSLRTEVTEGYEKAVEDERTERKTAITEVQQNISNIEVNVTNITKSITEINQKIVDEVSAREQTDENVTNLQTELERIEKEYKEADTAIYAVIEHLTNADFSDLEAAVRKNTNAITVLNGDKTVEGSVDYKIDQILKSIEEGQAGAVAEAKKELQEEDEKIRQEITDKTSQLTEQISDLDALLRQEITDRTTEDARIEKEYAAADAQTLQDAKDYADSLLAGADAMRFMGVLGEGEHLDLPITGVEAGDTYKVSKNGTYGPDEQDGYIGDLFIALEDQGAEDETYRGGWAHISSGYEASFDPDLMVNTNTSVLELYNGIGALKHSIKFGTDDRTNLTITPERDSFTFGMTWGEF